MRNGKIRFRQRRSVAARYRKPYSTASGGNVNGEENSVVGQFPITRVISMGGRNTKLEPTLH